MQKTQTDRLVIGITGGVGSGKSRILDILENQYQAKIIQADLVARALEEPGEAGLVALVDAFGEEILDDRGRLDRKRFAVRLFQDEEMRRKVNALIHPMTWDEIRRQAQGDGLIAVEAALFDAGSRSLCEYLVYVDTDEETRIARLMQGRGYTREQCLNMISSQPSRDYFLELADYVIDNNGTPEQAAGQLARMFSDIRRQRNTNTETEKETEQE